jgi:hypothetical protein
MPCPFNIADFINIIVFGENKYYEYPYYELPSNL